MARHDLDPALALAPDEGAEPSLSHEAIDRRGERLRTIGPLVSLERDWVDTDFVSARIWTE